MKSAIGIGALLMDGLGDTIRVSLTEDPEYEIDPCKRLAGLGEAACSSVSEPAGPGRGAASRRRAGRGQGQGSGARGGPCVLPCYAFHVTYLARIVSCRIISYHTYRIVLAHTGSRARGRPVAGRGGVRMAWSGVAQRELTR
jgi:4-hydroxy-3-methylbut-2-en-1-yl diphosphate synthase IspG/GcpE